MKDNKCIDINLSRANEHALHKSGAAAIPRYLG